MTARRENRPNAFSSIPALKAAIHENIATASPMTLRGEHALMTDAPEIPRRILPDRGQYVCPGSVFIPMTDGRCICGHPFGAHMHYNANGVVYDVSPEAQNEYLHPTREEN